MKSLTRHLVAAIFIAAGLAHSAHAQQKQDFAGDYTGTAGTMRVALHIAVAPDGAVTASVDSPAQGLVGLPCTGIQINGPALSFSVPNVRGEWTGVMSPDHNSLSGVWKQNGAVAVIFTRGSAPPPDASSPAPSPFAPSAAPASGCGGSGTISYWEGSAWKPMIAAAHLGGEHGFSLRDGLKNPFNVRAGVTNIVTFKNATAALILGEKPRFCASVPANMDPTVIMVGSIDAKKDRRELETCSGICGSRGHNMDDWLPAKKVQPVDIKRLSGNFVEITPKNTLKPGQYIIGGPPLIGYYDFGVGGTVPE